MTDKEPIFAVLPGIIEAMTLRDWLAGMAMQALIHQDADKVAEWAYEYADFMLAEREKGGV